MNDFHTYLVESYSNREIDPIIGSLRNTLEYTKALCSSKRNRKWTWAKGNKTDDYYALIRTLLTIDDRKSYSLEQITKLLNLPHEYIKKKLDYSIVMENCSTSKCHRSFRYRITNKGITKDNLFTEIIASQGLRESKDVSLDILVRLRSKGLTVDDIINCTTEDLMDMIADTPRGTSAVILKNIYERKHRTVCFKVARLSFTCLYKYGYKWIPDNTDKEMKALCDQYLNTFEGKLKDAMRNPVPMKRKFSGMGLEFSEDYYYYTFGNGQTRVVSLDDLKTYIYEEVLNLWKRDYYNSLSRLEL